MSHATAARAQVSPGPLARPHQDLDSNLKCFNCHGQRGQGGGSLPDRCLACHKEIASLVDRGVGLHGNVPKADCAKCHPDHAGLDFKMINWEEGSSERFDHQRTKWPLEGKHAQAKCRDCHKPEFLSPAVIGLAPGKDHAETWIGLDRGCSPCHKRQDVHRGALGNDCGKCHGQTVWKPATTFNHAKTDYPLTGRHAKVTCDKCHLATTLKLAVDKQGNRVPLYKPLPYKECTACHADPHANRFGPACARCHVTDNWKRVPQGTFNHDLTRYPLRGKHVPLQCGQCHDPVKAWGKKPLFQTCTACHADAHAGTAILLGKIVDCAACHDVQAWKPSTYTVEQHKAAAYPLEGAHRNTRCDACHRKDPAGAPPGRLGTAGVLIRMAHARCLDCHQDDHGGQLARRPDRGACEGCHHIDAWKPSTYTVAQHAKLRLPLLGRHSAITCAACHGPSRAGLPPLPGPETLGKAGVAILLKEIACEACHFDPHEGRFAAKGARPRPTGCVACHNADRFRPSTIDVAAHAKCGYPLEGAHGAAPCDTCHKELKTPRAASSLLLARGQAAAMPLSIKDQRCEACHQNPHGTQFAVRRDKGACVACHSALTFRPAIRFDHNRDAAYPLEGAHAKVACNRCHPAKKDAAGRAMVIYRPVPKDCKSCHGERIPGKRADLGALPTAKGGRS
jgi:hypothetical protein